jgi:hypothetical protein
MIYGLLRAYNFGGFFVMETAMSLLQEALVFSPTLQTQHFYLACVLGKDEGLPLDYASYQIETGQFKQAIETLE